MSLIIFGVFLKAPAPRVKGSHGILHFHLKKNNNKKTFLTLIAAEESLNPKDSNQKANKKNNYY